MSVSSAAKMVVFAEFTVQTQTTTTHQPTTPNQPPTTRQVSAVFIEEFSVAAAATPPACLPPGAALATRLGRGVSANGSALGGAASGLQRGGSGAVGGSAVVTPSESELEGGWGGGYWSVTSDGESSYPAGWDGDEEDEDGEDGDGGTPLAGAEGARARRRRRRRKADESLAMCRAVNRGAARPPSLEDLSALFDLFLHYLKFLCVSLPKDAAVLQASHHGQQVRFGLGKGWGGSGLGSMALVCGTGLLRMVLADVTVVCLREWSRPLITRSSPIITIANNAVHDRPGGADDVGPEPAGLGARRAAAGAHDLP
jgi:hypothetical protein